MENFKWAINLLKAKIFELQEDMLKFAMVNTTRNQYENRIHELEEAIKILETRR